MNIILSFLPPIVLFLVAIISHNILAAFSVGIFAALVIISHAHPLQMILLLYERIVSYLSDSSVLMSFVFLIAIGTIISFLSSIQKGVVPSKKKSSAIISTKKIAEYFGAFFAFIFSIDDYLSILTVGFLLTKLGQKFAISKERIAYIVHSLSGPLVILIPISSWAAEIVSQLYQSGVHMHNSDYTVIAQNPLFLYMQSMQYNFYSFLTIFSVFFFIHTQKNMDSKETAFSDQKQSEAFFFPIFDILMPLLLLLGLTIIGLSYTGNYSLFGGTHTFFQALQNSSSTFFVLAISAILSFFVSFFYQLKQHRVKITEISSFFLGGVQLMHGAILLIFLASLFGSFVRNDLKIGTLLAHALLQNISISFMPLVVFFTALFIAILTGTAWGTFALLIPIVIQMLLTTAHITFVEYGSEIPYLLPCLGAVFSGGVCGDHLSLFSETTIMTATATEITPIQHAKSQLQYAVFALFSTIILFASFTVLPPEQISPLVLTLIGCLLCAATSTIKTMFF